MTDFCAGLGEKPFRARQLYAWLYGKGVNDFAQMTDVPVAAREKLAACARADGLMLAETLSSADGQTTKYLFGTDDGNYIETVFMKYKDRNSICISTQAGCRMGCRFCASGSLGLARDLGPAEMALQVVLSEREAGARTKNIVLMGIGEPLDNFNNVKKFIENITDDHGRDLSRRAITLSTCGLVPGIRRLAEELPQVNLAISLHAPNDRLRERIMPVTKRYGVKDIVEAAREHFAATHRRPTFEYALIRGFNDGPEHAAELAALLKGMNCIVNLIPLNSAGGGGSGGGLRCGHGSSERTREGDERTRDGGLQGVCGGDERTSGGGLHGGYGSSERTSEGDERTCGGDWQGSDADKAEWFREELGRRHVPATVRNSLGADIEAACGQLRLRRS